MQRTVNTIVIFFLTTRLWGVTPPSCMGDVRDTARWYSFISQQLVNMPDAMRSYLLDTRKLAESYEEQMHRQESDNLLEWQGRFCSLPDTADIRYVVYHATDAELSNLYQAAFEKRRDIDYTLMGNRFAQVLKENQCTETIGYLLYARACEPHVGAMGISNWSNAPKRDFTAMTELIRRGRKEFRETKSVFLKTRYAFQIIRLAHYIKDYNNVLALCDELLPKMQRINSIVNYWIMAHKAGALLQLGRRPEAAYLYSLVFRYSSSKREAAYRSFDIRTAAEWQQALNLCRDNEQRATLYALRAAAPNSRSLEDLKFMYALDPKNPFLELLLLRETAKLEKVLLGKEFRRVEFSPAARDKAAQYLLDMRDFVHASAAGAKNPALWEVVEGYLTVLSGDYYHARKIFESVRPKVKDEALLQQLETFDVAARIGMMTLPMDFANDKEWKDIRASVHYNAHPAFERFFREKAGKLYAGAGAKGMAYLCAYGLEDLALNPQIEIVDELLAVAQKSKHSLFEEELFSQTQRKSILLDLLDIKGTSFLRKGELEAAYQCFSQIPESILKQMSFNPFTERIKDCVRCSTVDTALYDKRQLVRKLLDLELEARASPQNSAQAYFQLGLAHYNMSYFGSSYKVMDFFRSGASWRYLQTGNVVFPKMGRPNGNLENLEVDLALKYFELARRAAPEPELGAKATFWAAKCELINYYRSSQNQYRLGSRNVPNLPGQFRQYYNLLNSQYYQHTQFYKEVIKECKFFAYYARR